MEGNGPPRRSRVRPCQESVQMPDSVAQEAESQGGANAGAAYFHGSCAPHLAVSSTGLSSERAHGLRGQLHGAGGTCTWHDLKHHCIKPRGNG